MARHRDGFSAGLRAGRASLRGSARSVSASGPGDDDVSQQCRARRRCRSAVSSSFLPGNGVGGAGVHWNGQTWRFLPTDFQLRSHLEERYGKDALAGRHDDPGLAAQLRRDRALLRPLRKALRHLRQGRQYPRRKAAGRQSVRGLALVGISDAAAEAGTGRDAVRRSGAQDRPLCRFRSRRRISAKPMSIRSA